MWSSLCHLWFETFEAIISHTHAGYRTPAIPRQVAKAKLQASCLQNHGDIPGPMGHDTPAQNRDRAEHARNFLARAVIGIKTVLLIYPWPPVANDLFPGSASSVQADSFHLPTQGACIHGTGQRTWVAVPFSRSVRRGDAPINSRHFAAVRQGSPRGMRRRLLIAVPRTPPRSKKRHAD